MAGWGTCFSASNNIHFNFPPIMNDSRVWSTWQPEAVINNRIQAQENIHTNWGYRQYMVKNGLEIMKYNSMESCYDLGLNPNIETNTTPSENVPFMYKNSFDSSKPGYGYCSSDLKNPYLSRQQLNARLISPSINPAIFS